MNRLKMTTSAWQSIRKRLQLDASKFTESIDGDMTVVDFHSLQHCADTFKKIADSNARQGVAEITKAYVEMISEKKA